MGASTAGAALKLALDNHYSPLIAIRLRESDHDALAAVERGWQREEGEYLLAICDDEGRALVTNDVADFMAIARTWAAAGRSHPGLIFTSDASMSRSRNTIGRYVDALDDLLRRHPGEKASESGFTGCDRGSRPRSRERELWWVPGLFCDRQTTKELAEQLAQQFSVINYDRRGRGESGDTAPYAVEREVEDLGALITEAGGTASVYGHSSGAGLALNAAASGSPITQLVLHEPPYGPDDAL